MVFHSNSQMHSQTRNNGLWSVKPTHPPRAIVGCLHDFYAPLLCGHCHEYAGRVRLV